MIFFTKTIREIKYCLKFVTFTENKFSILIFFFFRFDRGFIVASEPRHMMFELGEKLIDEKIKEARREVNSRNFC